MASELKLTPRLDTAEAPRLRAKLQESQTTDVVIDAGDVELLGGQCLELLLAARSLWSKAGQTLTLANVSQQLEDDLQRFGLTPADLECGGQP